MKKLIALSVFLCLQIIAFGQNYSYEIKMSDFEQVSESEFQFDLYLRKGPGSQDFALYTMQCRWSHQASIVNGGSFQSSYLTIVGGVNPTGTQLYQKIGWFSNADFTRISSTQLNWATINAPGGGEEVTVISDTWLKVARFSAKLRNAANTGFHNFADTDPQFAFELSGLNTIVRRCAGWTGTNPGALMEGEENYQVPRASNGLTPALGVAVNTHPLCGYYLGGGNDWSSGNFWNNTLSAGHPAKNQLPGPTNNALIGVNAFISPATQVTVDHLILRSQGSLVIQSDASGTGSLIHNNPGVMAGIERFIPASNWLDIEDGWHFISSPVANFPISPAFTSDPPQSYDFYSWSEADNLWVNFKNTTEPPTWNSVNNGSTLFQLGKGYMVAYQTGSTRTFSGEINVGDVTIQNLPVSSGDNRSWHLLGNPFASSVNWYTGCSPSNIGGVAQVWNESNKSYTAINDNEAIPAAQGFMVQALNGGGGCLVLASGNRTHSGNGFYKSSLSYPVLKVRVSDPQNASCQETQIRLNPESTEGLDDRYDGEFLPGYAPRFYSVLEGKKLAVNSFPTLSANSRIPLNFEKKNGSVYLLQTEGLKSIPATAWLLDKKNQQQVNLSQNPIYSFTANDGDNPARFELFFTSVGIEKPENQEPFSAWLNGNEIHHTALQSRVEKATLTDMAGRQLITWHHPAGQVLRLESSLTAGWYVLRILSAEQFRSVKLFIP